MASYNKLVLIGNLTRDPETAVLASGTTLCKGGIAVNRKWKDAQGNAKEDVLFLDFTIFGKQAETFQQYMAKGSCVLLDGELRLETWEDKDGGKRSKHTMNVQAFRFMDPPAEKSSPRRESRPIPTRKPAYQAPPEAPAEDDIPF